MDEFTFLDKMFSRLYEARHFRAEDEKNLKPIKVGRAMVKPHSAFETMEIGIEYSIRDYLSMRETK